VELVRAAGGLEQLMGVEGAAQDSRIVGGSLTLCERLTRELGDSVRLNCQVQSVLQDDEAVMVQAAGQTVRARHVVVAVDPALCRRIDFGPDLPAPRRHLHAGWTMGTGVKFHVAYEAPFWRSKGLSGPLIADDGQVRLTFDATPAGGPGILVGFLGEAFSDDAALLEPDAAGRRRDRIA
jgi:monoamine oxidase